MRVLTPRQLCQFEEEGYLVIEDVLDPARDIGPVLAEYDGVLDEIAASLAAQGAIASDYRELPFSARLIRICMESGRNFRRSSISVSLRPESIPTRLSTSVRPSSGCSRRPDSSISCRM